MTKSMLIGLLLVLSGCAGTTKSAEDLDTHPYFDDPLEEISAVPADRVFYGPLF
jgi:hypothetical protein